MPWNDYPQAATDNAAKALKHRDEHDSDCGTVVGWNTARILAKAIFLMPTAKKFVVR